MSSLCSLWSKPLHGPYDNGDGILDVKYGYNQCIGHLSRENHCAATCLDCGYGYCHCLNSHCCCTEFEMKQMKRNKEPQLLLSSPNTALKEHQELQQQNLLKQKSKICDLCRWFGYPCLKCHKRNCDVCLFDHYTCLKCLNIDEAVQLYGNDNDKFMYRNWTIQAYNIKELYDSFNNKPSRQEAIKRQQIYDESRKTKRRANRKIFIHIHKRRHRKQNKSSRRALRCLKRKWRKNN
jgi:hypothetical protein